MKRNFFAFGLACLTLFSLTSCNNSNDFKPGGNPPYGPMSDIPPNGPIEGNISSGSVVLTPSDIKENTDIENTINGLANGAYDVSCDNGTSINLSNLDNKIYDGYSFSNSVLTITKGGIYLLTGKLDGSIIVDSFDDDVRIVLDNVEVSTLENSGSAAILFKNSSGLRVITVKTGTVNTLKNNTCADVNNSEGAVIKAKKNTTVVINGEGILNIDAVEEGSSGVNVKNRFITIGTNVNVNAIKNGIKADNGIILFNSLINVVALNDGIKTDLEPKSIDEAKSMASSDLGYIYIKNTSLNINATDDGIVANKLLYIDNSNDEVVKIVTNNGAPDVVNEKTKDLASGKGLKVSGIEFNNTFYDGDYQLIIKGGLYDINSNGDAVSSCGDTIIDGGSFTIASGDDGIHSDKITRINDGNINILKSYEGVEGSGVEILGGVINITSADDGINAANSSNKNFNFYIYINNADIIVNTSGDGIDSNGSLVIDGGNVYVYGPRSGANSSLDSDGDLLLNGGNVVCFCTKEMLEVPSKESKQPFVVLALDKSVNNSNVIVCDNDNNELINLNVNTSFQAIVLSLMDFKINQNYKIIIDGTEYSVTLTTVSNTIGNVGFNNRPNGPRW